MRYRPAVVHLPFSMRTNVKINLGLNVLRKRPDGYHDLETLFVPYFGVGDELSVELADEFSAEIIGATWPVESDLVVKAYRLLAAEFPSKARPVHIRLVKQAPVGAGLGGGSADAAFTLVELSKLWDLGLSEASLAGYAARLGSDCAFFVYNRPMLASGRGEVLSECPASVLSVLDGLRLEVVTSTDVAVSTAEAYRGIVPAVPSKSLLEVLQMPLEQWPSLLVNDFETTVFKAHPSLLDIKQSFYDRGAVYAAMSGSGSSVFGLFKK